MMLMIHESTGKIKCPTCNSLHTLSSPYNLKSISQQLLTNRAALYNKQEEEKAGFGVPILEPEIYEAEERSSTEEYEKLVGRIIPTKISYVAPILAHILVLLPFFGGIAGRIVFVKRFKINIGEGVNSNNRKEG